jgi:hypothetical protein
MATPHAVGDAPRDEPAPKQRQRAGKHSGRLLLRMPGSLHEELARASDREGVSLNQFITSVLAGAVGWGREDGATGPATNAPMARSKRLTILLATNLLLVAAAAISAIAFLIAAWLSR